MNPRPLAAQFLLSAALLLTPCAFAADIEWRPQKTWVFIVGTLEWEDSEAFESFPKENRRDEQLMRFFRQKGVPSNRLVYLSDGQATTSRVTAAFSKMLRQSAPGDLLFFYFTGHGYQSEDGRKTYFATYDASDDRGGWPVEGIVRAIGEKFRGDRVILTADCCFSGALVDGVRRLSRLKNDQSFACLASSTSKESSTGNWTFTEMLLAGLRGKSWADLNQDGSITIGELASSVSADMLFAETQVSVSLFTGAFQETTRIAAAAPRRNRAIGRRVEVKSEGAWYKGRIIDAKNNEYLIHYYGYEVEDDEWVDAGQLRGNRAQ